MASRKSNIALVHSNGNVRICSEGVMYEGPPPKAVGIQGCVSLIDLKMRIADRLKLQANQWVSRVVYKFRMQDTPLRYMAYDLVDDDDVKYAQEAYISNSDLQMELYVDITTSEVTDEADVVQPTNTVPLFGSGPSFQDGDYDFSVDELYKGRTFKCKETLVYTLKHYHIRRHFNYHVFESNSEKLSIGCYSGGDQCNMRLQAINVQNSGLWKISRFTGPHTCVTHAPSNDHKLLDENFICAHILPMLKTLQDISISFIVERINSIFGYKVSYMKAWKAKQKAIVKVYGDWDESYRRLPQLLGKLVETNQVVYQLDTDPYVTSDHREVPSMRVFRRVFWAFKPCIDSFSHCKQFIQIDRLHLYGKYAGELLVATTQDGDWSPLILAMAIVEKENDDNWSWFLSLLRMHVTDKDGICLISDHHISIKNAVVNEALGWQPPHAYHRYCIRHIGSNIRARCEDDRCKNLVINMAYQGVSTDVQSKMERLSRVNPTIHQMMSSIPLEQWTLAYDEGRRYGHMTTNVVECVNELLKGIRKLPITGMIQDTFNRMVQYYVDRLKATQAEISEGHKYTKSFRKEIFKVEQRANTFQVRRFDKQGIMFEVVEGLNLMTGEVGKIVEVHLVERRCGCGFFQALRYPCAHVIAACASCKMSWDPYVDPVYKLDTIIQCYTSNWWPIGEWSEWDPSCMSHPIVPNMRQLRKKGRSQST